MQQPDSAVRNTFKVATIRGVDVYVHWSWLIIFGLITWSLGDFYFQHFHSWNRATAIIVASISAILLFVTVLLHELAHSFVARARGLPVNQIILHLFGGVSNLTREPDDAPTELLVAIAGPLTSLALSGVCYLLFYLASGAPSEVLAVLNYLGVINLILVGFNLIPAFPLDGGRVMRAIIWWISGNLRAATRIATVVGQAIGYLFVFGGLIEAFFLGDVVGGVYLAFIGWFLQSAAGNSNQQVALEQLLRGVDVRDVMDPAPEAVPPDTPIGVLVDQHMLNQNQRAVPIADADGTLLGLVTLGDVRDVDRAEWTFVPVSRIMKPADQLLTVAASDHLANAVRLLAENRYHQLPVMEAGKQIGMLDRAHVLDYLHVRQKLGTTQGGGRGSDGVSAAS
jgi:Zn-dependent protease/predicted transcriptional regulator